MTPEQYKRLHSLYDSMDCIINHGVTPTGSNAVIREIESVYRDIFPNSPPVNMGCWSCISDMVKQCWNTYNNYKPVKSKKKILLFNHQPIGGVEYYRMIKPNHVLSLNYPEYEFTSINSAEVDFVPIGDKEVPFDEYVKGFDLIHFCRIIPSQDVINKFKSFGIPFGLDLDDYWELPEEHILFEDYKRNNTPQRIIDSIKAAHFVTCTTPILADEIKQFNSNVFILENGIDTEDESWQLDVSTSDKMRFGFMHGTTHKEDIASVSEAMHKVFRKLNGFQIVLGGFKAEPGKPSMSVVYEKLITDTFRRPKIDAGYINYLKQTTPINNDNWNECYKRVWGIEVKEFGHLYNQIDVSLIPLIENKFNSCKSELKMIEAGFKGKACIVSDVNPYKLLATEENSFIAKTGNEFYNKIKYCLSNQNSVQDKASKLREDVLSKYSLQLLTEKRKQVYDLYL